MASDVKLPLLKRAMKLLVEKLTEADHVAVVTYAGETALLLPSMKGDRKDVIMAAIDKVTPNGSTNGASGIMMAYDENRVLRHEDFNDDRIDAGDMGARTHRHRIVRSRARG